MLESIPGSSAAVVHFGCIPPLCAKLMMIDYIDVAEQALLTLHKISVDHAGQVTDNCYAFQNYFLSNTFHA
jgi:E3 ubiquitin-protein ligase TRIP12